MGNLLFNIMMIIRYIWRFFNEIKKVLPRKTDPPARIEVVECGTCPFSISDWNYEKEYEENYWCTYASGFKLNDKVAEDSIDDRCPLRKQTVLITVKR